MFSFISCVICSFDLIRAYAPNLTLNYIWSTLITFVKVVYGWQKRVNNKTTTTNNNTTSLHSKNLETSLHSGRENT